MSNCESLALEEMRPELSENCKLNVVAHVYNLLSSTLLHLKEENILNVEYFHNEHFVSKMYLSDNFEKLSTLNAGMQGNDADQVMAFIGNLGLWVRRLPWRNADHHNNRRLGRRELCRWQIRGRTAGTVSTRPRPHLIRLCWILSGTLIYTESRLAGVLPVHRNDDINTDTPSTSSSRCINLGKGGSETTL
jgi:hypothetical protein